MTLSNSSGLLNCLLAAKKKKNPICCSALQKRFLVLWQKPANPSISGCLAADPLRRWKRRGSSSSGEFGSAEMSRSPSPSFKHSSSELGKSCQVSKHPDCHALSTPCLGLVVETLLLVWGTREPPHPCHLPCPSRRTLAAHSRKIMQWSVKQPS